MLAWAGLPLTSQAQQYPLIYHDQTEGLGNLSVSALVQDPVGYLWVGTDNGLYRYDGTAFVRWGGLEIQRVWLLHVAGDGAVWVGTSNGLFRVHADGITQIRMNGQSITMQTQNNLVSSTNGRLLLTSVWQVLEIQPAGLDAWTVRPYFDEKALAAHPELQRVSRIHMARDGTLWLACRKALCRARGTQVEVLNRPIAEGDERGWSGFYEDHRGDLWLRSSDQVLQLPQGANNFIDRTPAQAGGAAGLFSTPLAEDAQGRILTRVHNGLARWQGERWEVIDARHGLNVIDGVTALLADQQGGLWLGTSGYGLVHWQGYRHLEAWTTKDGLLNEDGWSFLRDQDGQLQIGTSDGVWRLNATSQRAEPSSRKPLIHEIGSMAQDASGQLWIADFSGELWVLPRQAKVPIHVAKLSMIFRMFIDSQGRLWLCTQRGLFVINTAQGERIPKSADAEVNPDPAHGPRIYSGCETGKHTLWFTTDTGPWYWDGQHLQRVALHSPDPATVAPKSFEVLGCSDTGNAWMGGADVGGLWQIQPRGASWEVVNMTPPHLANLLVMGLHQDRRGWLWVSTDAGVHVWNGARWRSFNRDNGLVWNDANQNALYEDRDGSIWVGTSRGVQHISQADSLFETLRRGPPLISLMRGGHTVKQSAPISLAWAGPPLKISFASPWFESRRADRFHYRVLGLDETWAANSGSELTLSSLAPGHYRLEVLTENTDLQMRSPVAAVDFDIAAPWWRTPGFYAACTLLLFLLVWALYTWRVRRLAQRQRYLEALVAERTSELEASREQMRELALKDALTGVWNRRALMSMLEAELARSEREQQALTLVIVDADHFKQVNDTYGHLAGDAVLKELASRLQHLTRAYDVVGRYGGEEFLLLLPHLDTDRVEDRQRIEAFHRAISAQPVGIGEGVGILVTCSFGVASLTPGQPVTGEALIAQADAALYQAKDAGRNRIVYI
jgi:diguanylate cyclase (GGDEF)-like protein